MKAVSERQIPFAVGIAALVIGGVGLVLGLPTGIDLALTAIAGAAASGLALRSLQLDALNANIRRMGSGDLQTPIVGQGDLARVLEQMRVDLLRKLDTLSEEHQWSEALIQSVFEGIITCDTSWRIRFFSAGATRITGWESADALGQTIDQMLPLSTDSGNFADYVPSDSGRRTVIVRGQGGRTITLAVTRAKPIKAGEITIVIHDISEETRRRKAQTYFLANMSHEFRTPLAGMQASIELLQENLHSLSMRETEQLLNSIHLSLTVLHQLIDNLLESSKLEANHFSLNRHATELEPLLGEAIRVIEPMIARRAQKLVVEEPLSLPTMAVDRTRTIQLIVNLLSNASKYSPDGNVIEIAVARQGDCLRISVADRGRGIAPEQATSIFLPFVRLEPESQTDHGSGLGLSVVKAIAEAHQGQVGVEARSGGGTIFWFTLPIQVEAKTL